MSYWRFGAMIATSTVVMFGLMYLNTFVWAHVFWSETRAYMALLMGAAMAVIMLSFMWAMYRNRAVNAAIYAVAAVVFALSLWLVRSQTTVGDVAYMKAMIPHHSIAILTSNRAGIEDPRVRKLADEIIAAQQKEISEMRYLLAVLEGETDTPVPPSLREEDPPAVDGPDSVDRALARPVIATLDAQDLTDAEIETGLDGPAGCRFVRTERSDPILATSGPSGERGVMKLSGSLVRLSGSTDAAGPLPGEGIVMQAEGLALEVVPRNAPRETAGAPTADLRFMLEEGLTVGYRGTWACDG
jgi:hypothetical protein